MIYMYFYKKDCFFHRFNTNGSFSMGMLPWQKLLGKNPWKFCQIKTFIVLDRVQADGKALIMNQWLNPSFICITYT